MTAVLFEAGSWRICRTGYTDNSAIYHHCGDEYNLQKEWWCISHYDYCSFCLVDVPAEIRGLLALHRWER